MSEFVKVALAIDNSPFVNAVRKAAKSLSDFDRAMRRDRRAREIAAWSPERKEVQRDLQVIFAKAWADEGLVPSQDSIVREVVR